MPLILKPNIKKVISSKGFYATYGGLSFLGLSYGSYYRILKKNDVRFTDINFLIFVRDYIRQNGHKDFKISDLLTNDEVADDLLLNRNNG